LGEDDGGAGTLGKIVKIDDLSEAQQVISKSLSPTKVVSDLGTPGPGSLVISHHIM
jgi:hypothetical protein